jgi:hypothetical protein
MLQGILTVGAAGNLVKMTFHIIVLQSFLGPSAPQTPRFAERLLRSG